MGDVRFTAKSDFEKVKKDYLDLARHTAKVEAENRKLADTSRQTGRASQRAFGPGAVRNLAQYAAGVVTVGTAMRLTTSYFTAMREESERAFSSLEKLKETSLAMATVTRSPQELGASFARRDALAKRYGVEPMDVQAIQHAARSAGFERSTEYAVKASKFFGVEAVKEIGSTVPHIFEGVKADEAYEMVAKAAELSKSNNEQFGRIIPIAAEGGRALNAKASETFAALSAMTKLYGAPQTAAQRFAAFTSAAALDPRLRDKGVFGAVSAVREWSESERREFLGSNKELNSAFKAMSDKYDEMLSIEKQVAAAQGMVGRRESPISQAWIRAAATPETRAILQSDISRITQEVENRRRFGLAEADRQSAISDLSAAMDQMQVSPLQRWGGLAVAKYMQLLGRPRANIIGAGSHAAGLLNIGFPEGKYVEESVRGIAIGAPFKRQSQMMELDNAEVVKELREVNGNLRGLRGQVGRPGGGGVSRAAALAESDAQRE